MLHIVQLKSFCSVCFLSCLVRFLFELNVFPQVAQGNLLTVSCSFDVKAVSPSEDEQPLSSEMNKMVINSGFKIYLKRVCVNLCKLIK